MFLSTVARRHAEVSNDHWLGCWMHVLLWCACGR